MTSKFRGAAPKDRSLNTLEEFLVFSTLRKLNIFDLTNDIPDPTYIFYRDPQEGFIGKELALWQTRDQNYFAIDINNAPHGGHEVFYFGPYPAVIFGTHTYRHPTMVEYHTHSAHRVFAPHENIRTFLEHVHTHAGLYPFDPSQLHPHPMSGGLKSIPIACSSYAYDIANLLRHAKPNIDIISVRVQELSTEDTSGTPKEVEIEIMSFHRHQTAFEKYAAYVSGPHLVPGDDDMCSVNSPLSMGIDNLNHNVNKFLFGQKTIKTHVLLTCTTKSTYDKILKLGYNPSKEYSDISWDGSLWVSKTLSSK